MRSENTVLTAYSDYFDIITPATIAEQIITLDNTKFYLNAGIKALAILFGLIVIFITLWIIHHHKTKNAMPDEDTLTLRDSLRLVFLVELLTRTVKWLFSSCNENNNTANF